MKQLPDEITLKELLDLAKAAENEARKLWDLTAEIDEKWRMRISNTEESQKSDC